MAANLTFLSMQQEVLDNVAKSGSLNLQSGANLQVRVQTWINRAQLWLSRKVDLLNYDLTTATVAGQQTYAFPSTLRRSYTMRLIDGLNSRRLACTMPWEMDRKVPYAPALTQARSWFYIPFKETLTFQLFPIPDNVYGLELRCSLYPNDLVNPTDLSQYTDCDDAIIAYATMFAFRWLQETKDAEFWEEAGNEMVKMIKENADEAHRYVDWSPTPEGFSSHDIDFSGDYFNNPFIRDTNLNTWWR